jgi:WD40 repeat protein
MFRSRACLCILCAALAATLAFLFSFFPPEATAQAKAPAKSVSFINDVAPILKENCFGCHGAKSPKGKLDMTKHAAMLKGGTKEFDVIPGKPEDSYLISALTSLGKNRMPPKDTGDALAKEKIDVIRQWIKEGAKLDGGIKPDSDIMRELRIRWVPPVPPAAYEKAVVVTALAFTPDSKKVVVSGHHELNVFDATTGNLEKRIRTRSRRATAMFFLPDGKLVVAGGRPGEEGDIRVYNIDAAGKDVGGVKMLDGVNDKTVMLAQLLEADDEVLCIALSPDAKQIASGGCDRLVNIWDISAGVDKAKLVGTPIENHADWVFGVAFSPDGKKLFTASRDKTAKLWDITAKESVLTFPEHNNTVYGVLPTTDGKTGISAGEDNQLRQWDIAGGRAGKTKKNVAHGKAVLKLALVPGKPLVLSCSADATARVWNRETLAPAGTLSGFTDHVYAVAGSPDGTLVAAGAFNGEVRVFNIADAKMTKLIKAFNATPGLKPAK